MIVSCSVIHAEEVVASRQQPVDLACPVVAQLSTPVAREPEEGFLVVAERMVDSRCLRVENVAPGIVGYVVVLALGIRGLVRQRIEFQISLRYRAYPLWRDHVISERCALDAAVRQLRCRSGIIDHDSLAQKSREVPISFSRRRNRELKRLGELVSQTFEIEKDEGFVPAIVEPGYPDRAADRSSIPIVSERTAGLARPVQEKVIRRKYVVANKIIGSAVHTICSTLSGDVDYCAAGMALLGIKARRLYLEFLCRIS